MKGNFKGSISRLLMLFTCLLLFTVPVSAGTDFVINGVTVNEADFSSAPSACLTYTKKMYYKIWGETVVYVFNEEDNMLRDLSDEERLLTPELLKEFISHAQLGASLRVCSSRCLHDPWDSWGHAQTLVQKDANGFTVVEGGMAEWPYHREYYYTWEEYVNTNWLVGKYPYMRYITWPGAPSLKDIRDEEAKAAKAAEEAKKAKEAEEALKAEEAKAEAAEEIPVQLIAEQPVVEETAADRAEAEAVQNAAEEEQAAPEETPDNSADTAEEIQQDSVDSNEPAEPAESIAPSPVNQATENVNVPEIE